MKTQISNTCAWICSRLFYLLHNRKAPFYSREEFRWMGVSFSYCAEDLVVMQRAKQMKIEKGFYVDVGAFDPISFSNTLLLNKHGWRGINIDADNTKIEKFKKLRPNDCNIVAAVSDRTESLNFGRYPSGFANRIISKNQEDKKSNIGESPLEIVEIKTKSLTEIIDSTKYAGKKIDFLDVDCEGYDFNVIKSLDIEKYSPKIIAFEAFNEDERKTICEYLLKYRYKLSDIVDITTICILDK